MTLEQKNAIESLRSQGLGYRKIALKTGVSENTVKSYLRRSPVVSSSSILEEAVEADVAVEVNEDRETKPCHFCGEPVPQNPGRKEKKFCSSRKYCSHACYINGRFHSGENGGGAQ